MHIRILTASGFLLLCGLGLAQTAGKPLRADRVVVLKKERRLQLLSEGKVIKTYKVALGGDPVGPKIQQGDHKTPEGFYVLDERTLIAGSTSQFTFRIPTCAIARRRGGMACHQVGTCSCTACPTDMGG